MEKKKLNKKLRQVSAGVLAGAMVLTGIPFGGMTARAATVLQENPNLHPATGTQNAFASNVNGFTYGSSETTAYVFGDSKSPTNHTGTNSHSGGGTDSFTFNIGAVLDEAHRTNTSRGYYTTNAPTSPDNAPPLKSAYGNNWWHGYYAFGKPYKIGENVQHRDTTTGVFNATNPVDPIVTTWSGAAPTVSTYSASGDASKKGLHTGGGHKNGEVLTLMDGSSNKVEVRQEIKVSDDNQYILVQYTAYNASGATLDFMIGNQTDTQIGNQDAVPIFVTKHGENNPVFEGLHFQNSTTGDASSLSVFDIYTSGKGGAGLTKRDGSDPSETRAWAGKWNATAGTDHTNWVFSQSPAGFVNPGDSAGAFSAYMNLLPGESKTATFALAMKPNVFYVDPNYNGGTKTGFMGTPVNSIAEAMAKIGTSSFKKAYVYVQNDVEINSTINVPANKDVTIQTADFDALPPGQSFGEGYSANIPVAHSGNPYTIKRAAGFTGSMFHVNNAGSTLSFLDIIVDGNGANVTATAPIVEASAGKVAVKQNSTLQNNKVSGAGVASAIDVKGTAVLDLSAPTNSAEIKDNVSSDDGSAIMINSTAARPITIHGDVQINTNDNKSGQDRGNVYLGQKMFYVEEGKQFTGYIKVSLHKDKAPDGESKGTQIVDFHDSGNATAVPYSSANFGADLDGQYIQGGTTADQVTGSNNPQNPKFAYLRANFYDLTITYVKPDGSTIPYAQLTFQHGTEHVNANPFAKQMGSGASINFTMPTVGSLMYDRIEGLQTPSSIINTNGNLTGAMPAANTDLIIYFKRNEVTYKFDSQGGSAISDKTEAVTTGASVLNPMPTPVRAGFDFAGWFTYTDVNDNGVFDAGDTDGSQMTSFPNPAAAMTTKLYAKWNPGTTGYPVTTNHKNTNASLELNFGSDTSSHIITQAVDKDPYGLGVHSATPIPGYKYTRAMRVPATIGTLDNPTPGHFRIDSMPARGVSLTYRYSVDPAQRFNFKVKYVDGGGNELKTAVTVQKSAEQRITSMPDNNITGYTYSHLNITAGYTENLPAPNLLIGLETPGMLLANDNATGRFEAHMPNQDVTVEYVYTADAGSNLIRRFLDREDNRVITSIVDSIAPGAPINATFPTPGTPEGDRLYGYVWDGNSSALVVPNTAGAVNPGTGDLTGMMPLIGDNVKADYKLSRDGNKWRDINFALATSPYNEGVINPLPSGAPTRFLANDGTPAGASHSYNFGRLNALGYIPTLTPNRYYMFEGWFLDAAATQPVNTGDTFPTGTTPLTLYAKFVEDPNQWVDIHFVAGTNGSISAPASLHKPFDFTWGQILGDLPVPTAVANYNFLNWTDSSQNVMNATSTLTNGATYTANFGKDAPTWGTNVGAINPSGRIGSDGSGEIVIQGTTPGNVYVISDPAGNIIAVVPGDSTGNVTIVPDLIPGAHYNVQEGTPDTVATVGQPISSITATDISAPIDVYIPTVDNNYNIGYDPHNDGMAQIIVDPADPDADYALIDENGNVVQYPGSDNGWVTPSGNNPARVIFNNLNPNETYTVVARKKGDTSLPDPLAKLPDGNQIIANPGDMAEAQKYTVETIGGDIVTVGDENVGANVFTQAKAGKTVVIHADPVNANGKNFLYWSVLAGRAVGVSGKITQADYSFTLSNSNIVLKAVYEPTKIAGDDADLTENIRGGDVGEFGLHPDQIPNIANLLTTPIDRSLIGVNGAKVDYKVVFNKRNAKPLEKNLVKPISESGMYHEDAFTTAYALDILLERYVDGRKVDRIATSSNALPVDVIVQLPAADVDQLDYQLFDVTPDANGNIVPVLMHINGDVADNAGLLKFQGNLTHSYVLVYSKVFKVTFVDNHPVKDHLFLNDTSRNFYHQFKVRRKEAVEDSYYSGDYMIVTNYARNDVANALQTPFEDIYGVEYNYQNWSKKEDKLVVYDTTSPVTRKMVIYAYYSDNRKEVEKARVDLGGVIDEAKILANDPYLKLAEVAELNEAIAHAVETLRQARDLVSPNGTTYLRQANYVELQQAIDALRALIDRFNSLIDSRRNARNARTGGASGGGNSSSGRGSKLLTPGEKSTQQTATLEGSNTRAFVLGVDGAWATNPVTGGWSFVLNGGTPLNDMWGMISFKDEKGKDVSRWYYFDHKSTMATGWVFDSHNKNWYYMNTNEGPEIGQMVLGWIHDNQTNKWYYMNENTGIMKKGWHLDPQDNRWYYLNPDGAMLVGWHNIDGKYYFFNPVAPQNTYVWDNKAFRWNYLNNRSVRPYGSMYAGEKTPDGYNVDASGAWK